LEKPDFSFKTSNLGKVVITQPTIGSNVEEVVNKNVKLQVWDLGGQETLRASWQTYFYETSVRYFREISLNLMAYFMNFLNFL